MIVTMKSISPTTCTAGHHRAVDVRVERVRGGGSGVPEQRDLGALPLAGHQAHRRARRDGEGLRAHGRAPGPRTAHRQGRKTAIRRAGGGGVVQMLNISGRHPDTINNRKFGGECGNADRRSGCLVVDKKFGDVARMMSSLSIP